jgi:hypothetical protein
MPAGGWPLEIYFHGSGGFSNEVTDRGPVVTVGGPYTPGRGPAWVIAPHGLAAAGSAMPLNPERLPGAIDTEYLNLNNLAAFPYTFRQGVIEARLFLAALRTLTIDPSVVAAQCPALALPPGETAYHFDASKLVAQGQSMGGMYTNLVSAVEPRIQAVVPTGAGGDWSLFILVTRLIPGIGHTIGSIALATDVPLTFMHPALHLLETAWEPAEPFVSMARLARRPLPGHPVRPIYEPVGQGDKYFDETIYDGAALAYGNEEAGDTIWPTMQDALALDGRGGILPYPITNDRTAEDGTPFTGVVVQYKGDGIDDPHDIFQQLDAVKFQYSCFLASFLATGKATVPAPASLDTACPQ